MRLRLFLFGVLAALCARPCQAHIGSPAVVYDGTAGPYAIRVIVLPAPVIPGRAEINIRLLSDPRGPVKVTVLPVNWRAGLKGAPPADEAAAVAGEPLLRHAELWLMTGGSYSVHVTVAGARGMGTAIVPVVAAATSTLGMPAGLGWLLGLLGALLFAGAISVVAVGARDSVRPPDASLTPAARRRAWIAAVVAAPVFALIVFGGKHWWDGVDHQYRSNQIYRPSPMQAEISLSGGQRILHLTVLPDGTYADPKMRLIPDHGKLMHLFMIREPQLDALAHIHPLRDGRRRFHVVVPPLPAGTYRLYADLTYETGFAATLTTTVELPEPPAAENRTSLPVTAQRSDSGPLQTDPDDSYYLASNRSAAGPHLVLTSAATVPAHADTLLTFAVQDAAGHPVSTEPYMGMYGHAAIRRSDGSVFAHIHPDGTISMAAQSAFMAQAGVAMDHAHMLHLNSGPGPTEISFPYLFPKPGAYRIWVQTRVAGQVVTTPVDLTVTSG